MKTKQVGKKILSGLLTVCLVAGSIVITKPQKADAAGDNLVANGGFDTTTNWYAKSGNVEAVMPEQEQMKDVEIVEHIVNGDFEDAEYNYNEVWTSQSNLTYNVVTEEGRGRVLQIQQFNHLTCMDVSVALEAGKTYTISFDVKSVANETPGWVSYYLKDASWNILENGSWVPIPAGWTTHTYTYTPKTDQTGLIFQSCEQGAGDFYIDNFSVTTERTPVTELIPNGDFEDAEYNYNEVWTSQSNLTYNVVTEEGRGRVLQIQQFNHLTCMDVSVALEAGKTYTISFDVKSVANETPGWVSYYLKDASWNILENGSWVPIPAGWTTHTYTYTPKTDQTGLIFQSCEEGAGDFYIDNFSVKTEKSGITYSEGIGNCLGEESDNVLAMKEMTEATYKNVSLTAGKTYKYSYQVKAEGAASVTFAAGAQNVQTTAATSEWATVSGKFTAEADATEISFVRSGAGNLLIDDVEMYEVVKPVDHTTMEGGGAYIPAGHKNLYEGSTSSFADTNHGHGIVGNVTVADGIAELSIVNNNTTWIETMYVNVEAGKEYTFSAYVYVTEAIGDLQINLYTNGTGSKTGAWIDKALDDAAGTESSITANTDGWQLVQYTWTPKASGKVYFGIRNYGTGSATVYIDDFALTTAKDKVSTTISAPGVLAETEAYR